MKKVLNTQIDEFIQALTAISKVTSWAITWRAIDALEAAKADPQENHEGGSSDGWNFGWKFQVNGFNVWRLSGNCGYGSSMELFSTDNSFKLVTCGGHWVYGVQVKSGKYPQWRFIPDPHISEESWGDSALDLRDIDLSRYREDQILSEL